MKKYLFVLGCLSSTLTFATKRTISTVGFAFSPVNTEITQGDTIVFNVDGGHTATEVSQSTWNANGTTASGAFNLGAGNNQLVTNLSVGSHYFVCQMHVGSMGMKGTITVSVAAGVNNKTVDNNLLRLFPNPAKDILMFNNDEMLFTKKTITSINGEIVKVINTDKNTNEISIQDLPNGEYILSAYTKENEVYSQRFVKQ